jgi:hypothetical protein
MDESLIALMTLISIGALLLSPMLLCRRGAPQEAGLIPKYEAVGSCRIGWFRTNIPCVRLSIYEDFLVVAFITPTVFPLKNISARFKHSLFGAKFLEIKPTGQVSYVLSIRKPEDALQLLHT